MTEHELKCWPEYFEAMTSGRKNFDVRLNDRNFQEGDDLVLREYLPGPDEYSGRRLRARVTYVLRGTDLPFVASALRQGFCVLGLSYQWDA